MDKTGNPTNRGLATVAATLVLTIAAHADPAIVEGVDVSRSGNGWNFSVTISHGDMGWEDYADGWRVVAKDGSVLGTRTLLHPHVNEQPFTRSLSGVQIADDEGTVFIEVRTNVEGWSDVRFPVLLSQ